MCMSLPAYLPSCCGLHLHCPIPRVACTLRRRWLVLTSFRRLRSTPERPFDLPSSSTSASAPETCLVQTTGSRAVQAANAASASLRKPFAKHVMAFQVGDTFQARRETTQARQIDCSRGSHPWPPHRWQPTHSGQRKNKSEEPVPRKCRR